MCVVRHVVQRASCLYISAHLHYVAIWHLYAFIEAVNGGSAALDLVRTCSPYAYVAAHLICVLVQLRFCSIDLILAQRSKIAHLLIV